MEEPRKKIRVIVLLLSVMVAIIGILIIILSATVFKNWIVIAFNVRALNRIYFVGIVITIIGVVLAMIRGITMLMTSSAEKQKREQELTRKRQQVQVVAEYAENKTNPEVTRKRLEQIRDETPELSGLIERCLNQMDKMDILQEKQDLLITANDARFLQDTIAVLNNVERRLCRNFWNVSNLCIAADTPEFVNMEAVEKSLRDNEKKLSDAKELLRVSAEWINQYDGQNESKRSEVENWIAVIRDSLKED